MQIVRKLAIWPIRLYQYCISPLFPASCRYYPSCSAYAKEAIVVHGVLYGVYLSCRRLLRCNSLFEGGYDPVPPLQSPSEKIE